MYYMYKMYKMYSYIFCNMASVSLECLICIYFSGYIKKVSILYIIPCLDS